MSAFVLIQVSEPIEGLHILIANLGTELILGPADHEHASGISWPIDHR